MAKVTKISWCDRTASPWFICTEVSAACANCYARELAEGRMKAITGGRWGKGAPRIKSKTFEKNCLAWNREAEREGKRISVFPSLMDWLDSEAPVEYLADMLNVIRRCPNLTFLLLTKRIENWDSQLEKILIQEIYTDGVVNQVREFVRKWLNGQAPSNIWLGGSVEDQPSYDKRWSLAAQIPAVKRFVSYEPALASVNFHLSKTGFMHRDELGEADETWVKQPDWIIVGCESGKNRRNMADYPGHARYAIEQCRKAGVKCYHKQMPVNGKVSHDISEFPRDLRVQEMPSSP